MALYIDRDCDPPANLNVWSTTLVRLYRAGILFRELARARISASDVFTRLTCNAVTRNLKFSSGIASVRQKCLDIRAVLIYIYIYIYIYLPTT